MLIQRLSNDLKAKMLHRQIDVIIFRTGTAISFIPLAKYMLIDNFGGIFYVFESQFLFVLVQQAGANH